MVLPFPHPTIVSNSYSDMNDWMNNHELIALAQANMTSALQANTI